MSNHDIIKVSLEGHVDYNKINWGQLSKHISKYLEKRGIGGEGFRGLMNADFKEAEARKQRRRTNDLEDELDNQFVLDN